MHHLLHQRDLNPSCFEWIKDRVLPQQKRSSFHICSKHEGDFIQQYDLVRHPNNDTLNDFETKTKGLQT